jgi:hypothetical protein
VLCLLEKKKKKKKKCYSCNSSLPQQLHRTIKERHRRRRYDQILILNDSGTLTGAVNYVLSGTLASLPPPSSFIWPPAIRNLDLASSLLIYNRPSWVPPFTSRLGLFAAILLVSSHILFHELLSLEVYKL